jgi:hypothetical protein
MIEFYSPKESNFLYCLEVNLRDPEGWTDYHMQLLGKLGESATKIITARINIYIMEG